MGWYASTSLIERALVLDKFQEEMQRLVEDETIEMIADPKMVFEDIKSFPNALYNLLLFSGYLTASLIENSKAGTYRCEARIPNREVREVFEVSSMSWISQKLNIDLNDYNSLLNDLLKGNIDIFTQKLKDYLEISASFFSTHPKNAELFYNGFILGLVSAVSSYYFIETERESGFGHTDLMLIPKTTAKYQNALILEFKFSKLGENLRFLAQKALEQIEIKNYKAKIKDHKTVLRTLKVGLAFEGKNVEVAFKEEI
ncbi:MAG: PD-(D/E)XK nuclease domain-containing protein [Proteobacteria bacterium]|nr:PD-(D/E)XK nuclease domain-containing protein [Pseudomonadota bacterium]